MSVNGRADVWIDGTRFIANSNKVPLAKLQKYAGQWVARSSDGTRILAGDPDMLTLCGIVGRQGLKDSDVVYGMINAEDVGLA